MMLLDTSAAAAIGMYQRYISPHKGFCCAYRVHTGRRSCSAYALGIVERLGALALFTALPRQFARCKTAALAVALSRIEEEKRQRWAKACDSSVDIGDIACDCSDGFSGCGDGIGGCSW